MKWLTAIRTFLGALTDALLKGRTLGFWDKGPKP